MGFIPASRGKWDQTKSQSARKVSLGGQKKARINCQRQSGGAGGQGGPEGAHVGATPSQGEEVK